MRPDVIAAEGATAEWPRFRGLARCAGRRAAPGMPIHEDDVAVQLYTSGTTGRPKGVMLMHRNFTRTVAANASAQLAWNEWRDGDSAIQAMPVSHISGTGWGFICVHHGAACHVQRQFDIEQTFDMIDRYPDQQDFPGARRSAIPGAPPARGTHRFQLHP